MKKAISKKNLWDRTPLLVKSTLGRGLRLVPLEWLLGKGFRMNHDFVREAQWWPTERIREYQLERLQSICRLAYSETRYYSRAFDAIGFQPRDLKTLEDLARLPTIDRRTIQANTEEMCALAPTHYRVDMCLTGGTGGSPLTFYMDCRRSVIEYAYLVASWERAGYKLGTPRAVFCGNKHVRLHRNGLRHQYDPVLRQHEYSSFHMTDGNMRQYLEHVATIGPCFLHAFPSCLAAMTRFLRRSAIDAPSNVLGMIAESENVYSDQRVEIERAFGARMFSYYGHSEKLVLAAECEHSTDYHVWPTYGYFELLDEDGHPVTTPGQQGEIVGTGFINTVMPFIRYRTGDYATYVGRRCEACGREHAVLRDIRGHRTQEVLIGADGTALPWTGICMDNMDVDLSAFIHVRQLQFYQDTPGHAVLKIAPAEGFSHDSRQRIAEYFARRLVGMVDFTIELTDTIPLSPRGKVIYVDQRIPQITMVGPGDTLKEEGRQA